MTDKDLLRIAHDADLTDPDLGEWMIDYGYSEDQIKKFAELVAAAEREAIARFLETTDLCGDLIMDELAAAIRAMGAA